MNDILQDARANLARLVSCPGPHDFQVDVHATGKLLRNYCCTKCHGKVDLTAKSWYERGLEHATRKPT